MGLSGPESSIRLLSFRSSIQALLCYQIPQQFLLIFMPVCTVSRQPKENFEPVCFWMLQETFLDCVRHWVFSVGSLCHWRLCLKSLKCCANLFVCIYCWKQFHLHKLRFVPYVICINQMLKILKGRNFGTPFDFGTDLPSCQKNRSDLCHKGWMYDEEYEMNEKVDCIFRLFFSVMRNVCFMIGRSLIIGLY